VIESATSAGANVRGTAKNCILVFLDGGASQIDTFDLKEGPWTPSWFAPASYGDLRLPQGLLPRISEHASRLAIIRSGLAWAAVHQIATVWAQISRNPVGALGAIAPHIGAVVSLESQVRRKPGDVLPGFVALTYSPPELTVGRGVKAGSGYLSAEHSPLIVGASREGLPILDHPDGVDRLSRRIAMERVVSSLRGESEGAHVDAVDSARNGALRLIEGGVQPVFRFSDEDSVRYGGTRFGDSMLVARNLVAARRGTRFVQVTMTGWDNHNDIYLDQGVSLTKQCRVFDPAVGALLEDLAAAPGEQAGKTLLDETLVCAFGEFGRTPGNLNGSQGRDHYLLMSVLFAGGGVRGGTAIGATDDKGAAVVDFGWSGDRHVRPEDVTATIYSALGIDYTTVRHDDPLGRGFEYVPFARDGAYRPVDEIFG
jgi:hypothetical protein